MESNKFELINQSEKSKKEAEDFMKIAHMFKLG